MLTFRKLKSRAMKKLLLFIFLLPLLPNAQTIGITPFASGFQDVVDIAFNQVDLKMYVVQQNGIVRTVNPDGTIDPTPFMNISSLITTAGNEQGLLGMAFHPDYAGLSGYYFY